MDIEQVLVAASLLLLVSILASKISDRFGVPALLLFLALGMLAGSDGPGGIYFDDAALAQAVGVVALAYILFSGGLDTNWAGIKPILREGALLATLGVIVTALIMGILARFVLGISLQEGLLLGAIVSSTDAAAVLSILRSQSINLKSSLKPLLELESGSNDPMAVFLTISMVQVLTLPSISASNLLLGFLLQMPLGALAGYLSGRVIVALVNRIKLGFDGLYPVLTLSWVALTYGLTSLIGGNGFLAVYIAGILVGNRDFIHKRSLLRFHDGMAWLMQIAMFVTLGLLVFPSQLPPVFGVSLLLAICLMFVARPLSVLVSLIPSRLSLREKLFVAWVGLRGAVPIILATYPLLAGVPESPLIFNVVFFVVLTSALLQGMSVPFVARWLGVDTISVPSPTPPLEYMAIGGMSTDLKQIVVAASCTAANKAIVAIGLPEKFLIVLVGRDGGYFIPNGATVLLPGDVLWAITDQEAFYQAQAQLCTSAEAA